MLFPVEHAFVCGGKRLRGRLGFDVTLLLLSPSWLIFLLQHRAVRQLKSNTAQQLEIETKKMEERIRALKEQMFKEKEERE